MVQSALYRRSGSGAHLCLRGGWGGLSPLRDWCSPKVADAVARSRSPLAANESGSCPSSERPLALGGWADTGPLGAQSGSRLPPPPIRHPLPRRHARAGGGTRTDGPLVAAALPRTRPDSDSHVRLGCRQDNQAADLGHGRAGAPQRCRDAEVQRCRGAEVQRCRDALHAVRDALQSEMPCTAAAARCMT